MAHCAHIDAPHPVAVVRGYVRRAGLVYNPRPRQFVFDAGVLSAVKHRRGNLKAALARRPAQMRFQHLPQVHARGNAYRVEDDVHRSAVRQKRHIFFGQDLCDHALVAVPSRHLVALGYLARLSDPQPNHLFDARRQVVLIRAERLDVDNLAALAVRDAQGCVFHIARLFAEYRAQQLLFRAELSFPLGRYLANEDVARLDFGAHADDALFVQVAEAVLAHVGNIAGDLFRAQLGFARLYFVLFNVYGCELIFLDQPAAEDDGVLEVVALPAHKRHQHILPQRQLAFVRGQAVGEDVPRLDHIALAHDGALVDASSLVAADELQQFARVNLAVVVHDDYLVARSLHHHAVHLRYDHLPAVPRHALFQPRPHQRRLRL